MSKRPFLLALTLIAACDGGGHLTSTSVPLGAPIDTLSVPYSYLSEAVWLGGEQWAALAPNEHAAVLLDFANDTTAIVGGAAHPEYAEPFALFKSGDSLYLSDWGKRAVTVWHDNRFVRSMDIGQFVRGAFPEARDNAGRFYAKLSPSPGPDGSGNLDSAAIAAISGSRVDTVGQLAPPDIAEVFGDAGKRYEPRALSGMDQWGVLPDGTLWIARINQNRVDHRRPDDKWHRGSQLPDPVLLIEQEDRDLFFDQFPEELRSTAQRVPFAITKPPFVGAFADAEGDVWLVKNFAYADSTRSVQRVGPDGKLKAQFMFSGYGKVIGSNNELLLVAEPDGKGHRIMVYRVPAITDDDG